MTDILNSANESTKLADQLTQLARLTEATRTEFDLITARIGWLATSESFIFVAFATTIANYRSSGQFFQTAAAYLAIALPILGILIAIVVALSIRAAHSAADKLKNRRDEFIQKLPPDLRITLIASNEREHVFGNIPSLAIPWIIVVTWIGALLSLPPLPW